MKLKTSQEILHELVDVKGHSFNQIGIATGLGRAIFHKAYHGHRKMNEDSYRKLVEFAGSVKVNARSLN